MPEVIDLVSSEDEQEEDDVVVIPEPFATKREDSDDDDVVLVVESPRKAEVVLKKRKHAAVFTDDESSSSSSDSEVMDLTEAKDDDDMDDFERAMRREGRNDDGDDGEKKKKKKKKTTKLTESEKERRAEKRREARAKAKAEKQAKLAAAQGSVGTGVANASLTLYPCPRFSRDYPAVINVLKDRGFQVSEEEQQGVLNSLGTPATIRLEAKKEDAPPTNDDDDEDLRRAVRIIIVVDALHAAPANLRSTVMRAVGAYAKKEEVTVALLGKTRDASLPDIVFLERQVTLRCLVPPRIGKDPAVKAIQKVSELVTSYASCLVEKVKGVPQTGNGRSFGRPEAAASDDLLSGLEVKDVAKWTGAKPKSNTAAYPTFLRVVLPANAADTVAQAFPSFARLQAALEAQGPNCIADLTLPTAAKQRLGPALAQRLQAILSTKDPRLVPS